MTAHDDGVVFIERRDRIVDVDMFDPLVRLGPVERELEYRKEEAPDEDVLLSARNLDAVHLVGPRVVPHAAQYLAGEGHLGASDVASPLVERRSRS